MRKLPIRKLFAAGSLALCIGAIALWMRSTTEMDQLRTADPFRQTTLVSANGEFCVETVTAAAPEFDPGLEMAHSLPTQYGPRSLTSGPPKLSRTRAFFKCQVPPCLLQD
ncbi:MAG TPA: hypothetical protein VIM11_03485 [Tepidisphaeraceae bacterium]|jgi:hypothetical protein